MKKRAGKNSISLGLVLVLAALFIGGCPDPAGGPGANIENPDNPNDPGQLEVLPALTIGEALAAIAKDAQNANVLNVSITIPNGAAAGSIGLTDGTNFAFAGKTFNFNITFANGTYDEDMVNAIKGKFVAKGASEGTTVTTLDKPQEPPAPQP